VVFSGSYGPRVIDVSDGVAYANAKELRRLDILTVDDEQRFFVTVPKTVVGAIFCSVVHSAMESTNLTH
jgi:hypothetical protein